MPPWVIEDETSRYWFERINAFDKIQAEKAKRDEKRLRHGKNR